MGEDRTDYKRLFELLGIDAESIASDVSELKKGRFPRHILDTVLENKITEHPYKSALLEFLGQSLRDEGISSADVMKDALKYARRKQAEESISEYLGQDSDNNKAISSIIADYCIIMLKR